MMRRNVLVSAPWIPEFDRNRGAQRVDAMVRFLRDGGWSVTFLAERKVGDDWHAQRLRELGVATFVGYEHAQDVVARGRFDLALIAFWQPAERLIPIIRLESPETRIVLDTHDLYFLREARRHFGVEGRLDTHYGTEVARELNTYQQADALLTVSVKEADWLNDLVGPKRAEYLPMEERADQSAIPFEARQGILFVGNFRHLPNGDAVEYLCRDVAPLLAPELLTEHPVSIVGNNLDDKVRAYSKNLRNVHMIGWVPSVVPYLERARVCVVPLLYGAGVKGKVLQALMRGTPVVTTSIGAEGLDLVGDEHALIADTPVGLARGISRLLSESDTWKRISDAGRAHVLAVHDEDAVRQRFLKLVEEAMTRPATDGAVPEAFVHSRRRYEAYQRTVRSVQEVVRTKTEPGTVIVVVSKGDDALLALEGRTARHFPQAPDGAWAGYHPADDHSAVEHLEEQRSNGGRYLLIPETSFWWLHHYREFVSHLDASYARLHSDEQVVMYDLTQAPSTVVLDGAIERSAPTRVLVVGSHDQGGPGPSPEQVAALGNSRRYEIIPRWELNCQDGAKEDQCVGVAHAESAAWVVHVRDAAVARPGFLDDFLGLADRLGAERAQPPHVNGPEAGPPMTERLRGCVAREISASTPLPVKAVRADSAPDGPTMLIDAVPITLSQPLERGSDEAALSVLDVVAHDRTGTTPGVRRTGEGPSPLISVVIATYNRPELLAACLEGFCAQSLDDGQFEVVVVDDGSMAGRTGAVLDAYAGRLRLCQIRIDHAGRAAAKNLGVLLASGELVVFFDDDDRPEPRMLEELLRAHQRYPGENVAVLGHTDWAPELELTPLMYYLTHVDKMLFSYGNLRESDALDWRCFWEGRVSCKRRFLMHNGLHDQRLAYSIDIEMAWRLAHHGLEVRYWPAARSYMTRHLDLQDFCTRTEGKARAQATMALLHPCDEIQRYARITDALERWQSARDHLPGLMARAGELERRISNGWRVEDPRVEELYRCYRAILDAYSAKGVCEITAAGNGKAKTFAQPSTHRAAAASKSGRRPQLTVTIPVWSRTPELADMARQTVDRIWDVSRLATEVLIIDNGSPHERRFRGRVHRFPENRGVSAAWNEGIARAEAPVVAVLNSDCRVEPGWDEALYEAATAGRRIAFPYTDHGDGRGFRQPDQGGTSGWCFALTMRLFREIGVFDERFSPAFCEDTDYWHRAWEMGVELSPVPAARVTHVRRATTGLDAHVDWLLQGHRYKYGWKHGVDPHRAPPYYNRTIVEYHCRGQTALVST